MDGQTSSSLGPVPRDDLKAMCSALQGHNCARTVFYSIYFSFIYFPRRHTVPSPSLIWLPWSTPKLSPPPPFRSPACSRNPPIIVCSQGTDKFTGGRTLSWRTVSWRTVSWRTVSWRTLSWSTVSWMTLSWRKVSWRLTPEGPSLERQPTEGHSPEGLSPEGHSPEGHSTEGPSTEEHSPEVAPPTKRKKHLIWKSILRMVWISGIKKRLNMN